MEHDAFLFQSLHSSGAESDSEHSRGMGALAHRSHWFPYYQITQTIGSLNWWERVQLILKHHAFLIDRLFKI